MHWNWFVEKRVPGWLGEGGVWAGLVKKIKQKANHAEADRTGQKDDSESGSLGGLAVLAEADRTCEKADLESEPLGGLTALSQTQTSSPSGSKSHRRKRWDRTR